MDFEILWTDPAIEQFEAAVRMVAEQSPAGAEIVTQGILEKVESLRALPFLGAVYAPRARSHIREVQSGRYRIFYRVKERTQLVEILSVWHGARREPRL